jgi:menaquinone-dependent protoporphyrinogen oxidase
MAKILIAYSTVDGQTGRICARLQQRLEARAHAVTLVQMSDDRAIDAGPFDKVIIGASVRYGKHRRHVHRFIAENARKLDGKPSVLFTVNLVARKPEKSTPETNPYLRKLLEELRWQPGHTAVFAGRLDYALYGFWDRQIIRLIMKLTGGPTARDAQVEYTDWGQVDALAERICAL